MNKDLCPGAAILEKIDAQEFNSCGRRKVYPQRANQAALEGERQAERPAETVSRVEFLNLFAAGFLPMFMAAVELLL